MTPRPHGEFLHTATRIRLSVLFAACSALLALVPSCGSKMANPDAPDPAKSKIELKTTTPFADGIDAAIVEISVVDSRGRALPGCVVEMRNASPAGRIDQPGTTDAAGRARAIIESSSPGTQTYEVVVDPGAHETLLSGAFPIRFLEPPSATLSNVTLSRSSAPANGETEVLLTATLSDGSGNPLDGHEVRFDVDDPLATIVQPTSKSDGSGVVTGSVRTTRAGSVRVMAIVNPDGRPRILMNQPTISFSADPLVPDDGETIFGKLATSTPRLRSLGKVSGVWSTESVLAGVATTIRHVTVAYSPTSNHERVAMVLAEDGSNSKLSLLRQIGDGWLESFSTTAIPVAHADKRCFDAAFEDLSGECLVVGSKGTATSASGGSPLWYRTNVGGTWSAELELPINDGSGPLPELGSGVPLWVELVQRPDSNEVALAWVDDAAVLSVIVWDGALWKTGTSRILTTAATTNAVSHVAHNRGFDLAWESVSKGLVAAWGEPTVAGFVSSRLDPASGVWSTRTEVTVQNGAAEHIDLAADPSGDRIALVACDLGGTERLGVAMWNGSSWTQSSEIDSQIRDVNHGARGDHPAEVAWLGMTGVAVCVYPDNASARIDWCRYTEGGGWAMQTPFGVSGKGFTESVVLRSYSTSNHVLAVIGDSYGKLWAAKYDGTSWVVTNAAAPIEPTLSTLDGRAFDSALKLR
ncbi:MAG: Ig-like domain-containing protein [Planctomycetes bacterium]|nr:Ig-like domain-containing protein [Planctomycetota bacterium]